VADRNAKAIKVRVRQLAENFDIDVIFGKALRVLGRAAFSEPIRNFLHRGAPSHAPYAAPWQRYPIEEFWAISAEVFSG
jgi:hypothetical protein